MLSTVESGLTNLIHDHCSCSLFTLSSVGVVNWMCPLKREQATRVSYNTLTHSRVDYIVEIGRNKVGHELKLSQKLKVVSFYGTQCVMYNTP